MFNKRLVVLMTATAFPGAYADALTATDPGERVRSYAAALRFWLELSDPRIEGIVVCDNSTTDFSSIKSYIADLANNRPIEWLGFLGNERPPGMHYGYAELGQIDFALENSELLRDSAFFLKATGRLIFPRVVALLDALDEDTLFCADFRRAYRKEHGVRARARTQLIFSNKKFYRQQFFGRRDEMFGKCSHIEEYMALKLFPNHLRPRIKLRFPVECPAAGIDGSTGRSLSGPLEVAKSAARGVVRRLLPELWL